MPSIKVVSVMTTIIADSAIASELQDMIELGTITPEIKEVCKQIVIPKTLQYVLFALALLYGFLSILHYSSTNYASALAAVGPMLTSFYIFFNLKKKGE